MLRCLIEELLNLYYYTRLQLTHSITTHPLSPSDYPYKNSSNTVTNTYVRQTQRKNTQPTVFISAQTTLSKVRTKKNI